MLSPKIIREQVDKSLAVVNAEGYRYRQPHMLSAGQIQRVALSGVLAMQPDAIIFDETTAMLDPIGRQDVLQCMVDLNRMGIRSFLSHTLWKK
jgi:energy-coupling factor transporter ATP-binding protein EcfA2